MVIGLVSQHHGERCTSSLSLCQQITMSLISPCLKAGALRLRLVVRRHAANAPINLFGWAVGRQHNLFLQVVQRVKRMKEFLLGALFASDKFDIVNCRTSTETISKTDHAVKAEGIDYFVWTEHGRSPASGVFPIPTPP